jgi:hypothetical protein
MRLHFILEVGGGEKLIIDLAVLRYGGKHD